jgi:peptide-methionine (S)-S-oxide reductase
MDDQGRFRRATFASGCFWDLEAEYRKIDGVVGTVVGYTGGNVPNPTYDQVESGLTGHVEAVGIMFDPAIVSFDQLLDIFWMVHNPREAVGHGECHGSQYRSAIFFHDKSQEAAARQSLSRVRQTNRPLTDPILTEILPAEKFWPAEECHQQFYEKCGKGYSISRQADE